MKIAPFDDRVLIRKIVAIGEDVRDGIIVPAASADAPTQAHVVAVGPGKEGRDGKRRPIEVEVGARIFISKHGSTAVKIDGETFHMVVAGDILAVLE